MLTFEEVKARLKRIEETILLEVLDISSDDLVERFEDIIEERYEELVEELQEEEQDQ